MHKGQAAIAHETNSHTTANLFAFFGIFFLRTTSVFQIVPNPVNHIDQSNMAFRNETCGNFIAVFQAVDFTNLSFVNTKCVCCFINLGFISNVNLGLTKTAVCGGDHIIGHSRGNIDFYIGDIVATCRTNCGIHLYPRSKESVTAGIHFNISLLSYNFTILGETCFIMHVFGVTFAVSLQGFAAVPNHFNRFTGSLCQ